MIELLPASPNKEITHNDVRTKVNELATFTNDNFGVGTEGDKPISPNTGYKYHNTTTTKSEYYNGVEYKRILDEDDTFVINITAPPYNAVGDFSNDDTTAIQNAINQASSNGGGVVYLPTPSVAYGISTPLMLPNKVRLVGEGMEATTIKALAGFTGSSLIKTTNFDALTGTNKWLVSDGLVYGFGIEHITLDGNNLAVKGYELYAKGYFIYKVKIQFCGNGGAYTEAGDIGGQSQPEDMPEAITDHLYTYRCGGFGLEQLGPHDAFVRNVYISGNNLATSKGIRVARLPGVYSGQCEMGNLHIYGLQSDGFYTNTAIQANLIISESVKERPIIIDAANCQISKIKSYGSTLLDNETIMQINGSRNYIGGADLIVTGTLNAKGIVCTGNENNINAVVDGGNVSTTGFELEGRGNVVEVVTHSCATKGFSHNSLASGNCVDNKVKLHTRNNGLGLDLNNVASSGNEYVVTGFSNSTEVNGTLGFRDDIKGKLSGKYFDDYIESIDTIDLSTISAQDIVIPHNLLYIPDTKKSNVYLTRSTIANFGMDHLRIKTVTATNVTVTAKVGTTGAGTASFVVQLSV